jgi:hypothetical protein
MIQPVNRISRHPSPRRILFALASLAMIPAALNADPIASRRTVDVSRAPGKPWIPMEVRTLEDLPPIATDSPAGKYGGVGPADAKRATGFFHTNLIDGRWWLIDPDGRRFIHQGIASVRPVPTKGAHAAMIERFGSPEGWASQTAAFLHGHGFNGIGAWSDDAALRPADNRLVYTKLWNFMSAYGKKRGGTYQKPGHTGYPGDCPFIFDPGFPAFCEEHARQLAATRDDPWLLGHFTDNELPWNLKMLDRYLKLPASDHGHLAATRWLKQRHGGRTITDRDREDFVAFAGDTYFRAVCAAIRKHDPNHLVLGARFHSPTFKLKSLFEAAGRHLDVISVNYYHAWTPDQELLRSWSAAAGKPILITEWYAKGMDSGLANTSGAGWLVKTQRDRGLFYQNFTLGLLESRACVGWHWFRYSDNDPAEKGADPSNRDSNKGVVSNRYVPYQELLDPMREINTRSFNLIGHFDRSPSSKH